MAKRKGQSKAAQRKGGRASPKKGKRGSTAKRKPKLGSGKRFKSLKGKLAKRKGVKNPGALAASIGRKKYGKKRMAKMSAAGRKRRRR